jgi:hypothetical protein
MSKSDEMLRAFDPQALDAYSIEQKWQVLAALRRRLNMTGRPWQGGSVSLRFMPVLSNASWSADADVVSLRLSNGWKARLPAMEGQAHIAGDELKASTVICSVDHVLAAVERADADSVTSLTWESLGGLNLPLTVTIRADFSTVPLVQTFEDPLGISVIRRGGKIACDGDIVEWMARLPRGEWDFDRYPNALQNEYGEWQVKLTSLKLEERGVLTGAVYVFNPRPEADAEYAFLVDRYMIETRDFSIHPLDVLGTTKSSTKQIDQLLVRSWKTMAKG